MLYNIIVNKLQIKQTIESSAFFKGRSLAIKAAQSYTDIKKKQFLQDFVEHPISQQLLDGPSQNYGVDGQNGNLFTFLGFDEGSNPVQDLYKYFNNNIKLEQTYNYDKASKSFIFKITYPNQEEAKDFTDMSKYCTSDNNSAWGEGRSWAYSIERGIPGLANYKFSDDQKVLGGSSRSGAGLQRHNVIHRGAFYKPKKYLTELLKSLIKK